MPLTIALAIMSIISGIATLVAVPGFFYAAGLQRSYTAPKPSAMSTTYGDYSGDALREDCEAIPATITRTGVPPMSRAEMVRIINKAALDFKISPTIIAAIIRQESTYDAEAQSGVGAGGLMQFMSDTWQDEYKIDTYKTSFAALIAANSKLDPANYPDNRFNPGANVYFGTGYIKKQIDYFQGDTSKGLAAYNAGAGNVEKYGGIPPFSETQNYVSEITQSISEFEKCLTESSSGAAEKLKKWVNENPQRSCQFTTDVTTPGGSACYRTARGVIDQVFPGNTDEGNMYSRSSHDPNQQDLDNLKNLLSQDKIPVLQVRGDASGQHWIAITGVKGNSVDTAVVEFYDPATGRIESRKFNSPSGSRHGGYYFGINTTQSTDRNLRGIIIEPNN